MTHNTHTHYAHTHKTHTHTHTLTHTKHTHTHTTLTHITHTSGIGWEQVTRGEWALVRHTAKVRWPQARKGQSRIAKHRADRCVRYFSLFGPQYPFFFCCLLFVVCCLFCSFNHFLFSSTLQLQAFFLLLFTLFFFREIAEHAKRADAYTSAGRRRGWQGYVIYVQYFLFVDSYLNYSVQVTRSYVYCRIKTYVSSLSSYFLICVRG